MVASVFHYRQNSMTFELGLVEGRVSKIDPFCILYVWILSGISAMFTTGILLFFEIFRQNAPLPHCHMVYYVSMFTDVWWEFQ